jgi:TetR/AcrR family transcriptional regulator
MKSRDRILSAAIPVFARKGRHGAHMEEIAALAHINKAMIYYIFHNKDELYLEVLKFVFNEASFSISEISAEGLENGKGCAEILSEFISKQITFFNENRQYTKIMVDAMSNAAEEIPIAIQYFKSNHGGSAPTSGLKTVIERGKTEKIFRDVDTDHLIISMIGMVIVYFFSQSITEGLDIEVKDETEFLEHRRKSIIDLVLNSILIPQTEVSKKKVKSRKQ